MPEEKMDTRALLRGLALIATVSAEMPISRIRILLIVARQPGILVREIMKTTGMSQSAVSRGLQALGSSTVRGQKEPANLVEIRPDPEDPRRVRCYLTRRGQALVAQVLEATAN